MRVDYTARKRMLEVAPKLQKKFCPSFRAQKIILEVIKSYFITAGREGVQNIKKGEKSMQKETYYVMKIERGAYVIGSSTEFEWKESVQPTKAQIVQKAIQHLVKKNAISGKYSVYYRDEDVIFDFVKRV